jgi:hypothetical protein
MRVCSFTFLPPRVFSGCVFDLGGRGRCTDADDVVKATGGESSCVRVFLRVFDLDNKTEQ